MIEKVKLDWLKGLMEKQNLFRKQNHQGMYLFQPFTDFALQLA